MKKILSLFLTIPLWFVFFFSRFMVRDKNLVVFGVHTRSFSGNIKSLLLSSHLEDLECVLIVNSNKLMTEANGLGFRSHFKYSMQGIYYALKAGTYVYSGFPSDINFWLSDGAKYINVWHGTPIKKIERDVTTGYYSLRNRHEWVYRILAPYLLVKPDVLLVSSEYEEKCFKSAFDLETESIFRAFPPRLENLINSNIHKGEYKNILYVPTWRDDHSFHFTDYVDLKSFNEFLVENKMRLYIKLHPSDKSVKIKEVFSNVIIVNQNEDVYNFLKDTNVVVSDYSSIVFESLYLSTPVVLFCPDYEAYRKNSREFYIDPCKELPVAVSYTQKELEKKILALMEEIKIDSTKFKSFKPYAIEDKILQKLVEKAHIEL